MVLRSGSIPLLIFMLTTHNYCSKIHQVSIHKSKRLTSEQITLNNSIHKSKRQRFAIFCSLSARFLSTKPNKTLAHVTHDVTPVQPKLNHKRNQKKLDVDQFNSRNDLVKIEENNNYFKQFLSGF